MTTQRTFKPHLFAPYAEDSQICRYCDRGRYALHHEQPRSEQPSSGIDEVDRLQRALTPQTAQRLADSDSDAEHDDNEQMYHFFRICPDLKEATEHDNAPAAPERGDNIAQRAIAYLVLNGVVHAGQYWPDEIVEWARNLMTGEPRCGVELVRLAIEQHSTLITQREQLTQAAQSVVERLKDLPRFLEKNNSATLASITAEALADLAAAIPAEVITTSEQEGRRER